MSVAPVDQATRLRDMMRTNTAPAAPRPRTTHLHASRAGSARAIAVASGKGGVGKTVIASNLAIALARQGHRVVLVDADLGTANIDVVMSIDAPYDLSHVVRGERSIEDVAIEVEPGLRVVAGASGLASIADLSANARMALIDGLSSLEQGADLIVLDCGAGISQNVLSFALAADLILVVTTPEPTSLTDAYALVKVVARSPNPPEIGVVVNQASGEREAREVGQRLASVAHKFLGVTLRTAGHIRQDDHVRRAVRQRLPVLARYPRSPGAIGLTALARRVAGSSADGPGPGGFFRRVADLFY